MRRSKLKQIAKKIAAEVEKKPYEYWANADLPFSYLREQDGEQLAVELVLLEKNTDYIQIGVCVDDGGLSAYFPPSWSAVIYQRKPTDYNDL